MVRQRVCVSFEEQSVGHVSYVSLLFTSCAKACSEETISRWPPLARGITTAKPCCSKGDRHSVRPHPIASFIVAGARRKVSCERRPEAVDLRCEHFCGDGEQWDDPRSAW